MNLALASSTSAFSDLPPPPAPSNIVELRNASARLIVNEPAYGWRDNVKARLNELVRLPAGWDGYRAHPVSFVNANFALRMLEAICGAHAPSPQVVPGSDGDLQIEWHTLFGDLEIHVLAPNHVHAWRSRGGVSEELQLTTDFTIVAKWVLELSEPTLAAGASAA